MSFITRIFKKKSPPAQTDPGDPPDAIDIPKPAPAPIARPKPPLWNGPVTVITPDPPKKRSTRFINYAEADPGLRAEMDKIMAPLAQNPADLATARSLGAGEMESLVNMSLYIVGLCAKKDEISTQLLDEKRQAIEPRRQAALIALDSSISARSRKPHAATRPTISPPRRRNSRTAATLPTRSAWARPKASGMKFMTAFSR